MHPARDGAERRISGVEYRLYASSSRLAKAARGGELVGPKTGSYSCADPQDTDHSAGA